MTKKNDFNSYRFGDLNYSEVSNKYFTMDRVSEDENKIVVKVGENHIIPTKYGFALILDATRVVFVKEWQVSPNWFGIEVMLCRDYFNVKEWGDHEQFEESDENLTFDSWLEVAKEQQEAGTLVKWYKKD